MGPGPGPATKNALAWPMARALFVAGRARAHVVGPMDPVLCPLSYVLCPMSYVLCPMSYGLCPMSYGLWPVAYVLCPMSDPMDRRVASMSLAWR